MDKRKLFLLSSIFEATLDLNIHVQSTNIVAQSWEKWAFSSNLINMPRTKRVAAPILIFYARSSASYRNVIN